MKLKRGAWYSLFCMLTTRVVTAQLDLNKKSSLPEDKLTDVYEAPDSEGFPDGFQMAPYVIYPKGIAQFETSRSVSTTDEPSHMVEQAPELGDLENLYVSTVFAEFVSSIPYTDHLPAQIAVKQSTEVSTEVVTEYYTLYSAKSIAPITTTVTVFASDIQTETGNAAVASLEPLILMTTYTLATTEYQTTSITEAAHVNSNILIKTATTTLPPTRTLLASTTTVLLTATNTNDVTATQTTQSSLVAATRTGDVTATETITATLSTTLVESSILTSIEPIYVTTQMYVTMTHTQMVNNYVPPLPPNTPASSSNLPASNPAPSSSSASPSPKSNNDDDGGVELCGNAPHMRFNKARC
ncbi:hypothetical protein BX667DRAFT_504672 [Coemansia mojavensis]|nr:hypothetical protein BX667DRAFT_504672 [Coemansia mojavensis]